MHGGAQRFPIPDLPVVDLPSTVADIPNCQEPSN